MKTKNYFLLMLSLFMTACANSNIPSDSNQSDSQTSEKEDFSDHESMTDSDDVSSDEQTTEVGKEEVNKVHFNKSYSVYINPSVQYSNSYIIGDTNEGYQMNQLANHLYYKLKEKTNLVVYGNFDYPGLSLSQSMKESNSLQVDAHIALHTNGGGGKGSEAYYKTSGGKVLAQSLLDSLNEILPYPTRGVKSTTSLYETNTSTAKAATLVEILFHDEKNQATFLINEMDTIADALVDGIITYFSENDI